MLSRGQWLCVGLGLLVTVVGCEKPKEPITTVAKETPDYYKPLPAGERALVKLTDPATWPDFSEGFYRKTGLQEAGANSLEYLSKPSSQGFFPYGEITHQRAVASIEAFLDVLQSAGSAAELDAAIKERFDIYQSRGCDERGTVLFTGYYRPIFDARLKPDQEYRYPLYKRPPDLVQDPVSFKYSPYLTRAEIDGGALGGKGLELCYLGDRFEAYIVTVQGSGKLRLADGTFFEIGYAGDNGREYSSVGQSLVERNLISPSDLSLQGLIRFFKQHPEELDKAMTVNQRYVFFTPRSGGPFGSLNVPVTPFRTIATDKEVYPRACVAFLNTQLPALGAGGQITPNAYAGFAWDQDTGGAIRAAGRTDLFLGTGPDVGELAGRTFAEGKLYYIFVKPGYERSGTLASPAAPAVPAHSPSAGPRRS